MNNTTAEIMRAIILEAPGSVFSSPLHSGGLLPWPLYVSTLPDGVGTPDNAGCVYDVTGIIRKRLLSGGKYVEDKGVQVKARGLSYPQTLTILDNLADYLQTFRRQTVTVSSNSYFIDGIIRTSPVISTGQDEKRRAICTLNLLVCIGES